MKPGFCGKLRDSFEDCVMILILAETDWPKVLWHTSEVAVIVAALFFIIKRVKGKNASDDSEKQPGNTHQTKDVLDD